MENFVVFTDLDGTLLDHDTYSYKPAKKTFKRLRKSHIPVIFCTSKNRPEIESCQKKLKIKDPFISENGGAIYIPKTYFDFEFDFDKETKKYFVIELGSRYIELLDVLNKIKQRFQVVGFSEMTAFELSKDSSLGFFKARLAKKREYDEAFKIINMGNEDKIEEIIKKEGFKMTKGGRYHHIMGKSDKGKAVKLLSRLYKRKLEKIKTIGLGDSKNDFEMLDNVDVGVIIQKKDGSYASKKYKKADGAGPIGWSNAIKEAIFSVKQKES